MKTLHTRLAACMLMVGCLAGPLHAQSTFKGTALPRGITTAYEELMPRLSPDDQTLYFVRTQDPANVGGRAGGQDIWMATRSTSGDWGPATHAGPVLNNLHHNFVGAVIDQGNTVLLGNLYGDAAATAQPGISRSSRTDGQWSVPVTVIGPKSFPKESKFVDFHATPDGTVIVVSILRTGSALEDLAVCFRQADGSYAAPMSLGDDINTAEGFEAAPFLTADTRTLFFSSDALGGEGGADIFVATRLDDTWQHWSEPINLGPEVNTAGFDGHWIMDSRGVNGYFVSGNSPTALGDIYTVAVRDVPALRAARADTLQLATAIGQTQALDLGAFGVDAGNVRFVSVRAIDGKGRIALDDAKTGLLYYPPFMFEGVEHYTLSVCDPPQSDDCHKIVVRAQVGAATQPMVQHIALRTAKNKNLPINLSLGDISLGETHRQYASQPGPKGNIGLPASPKPTLLYSPPVDFVGHDSLRVYGLCPNGETSNCLLAVVQIDIYEQPAAVAVKPVVKPVVAVVDSPKVVTKPVVKPVVVVVDSPKVVIKPVVKPVVAVVDSPKVVIKPVVKPVVAVVDSPKVVIKPVVKPVVAVVDSPKVAVKPVVAVVDSPKVVIKPVVKPVVAVVDSPKVAVKPVVAVVDSPKVVIKPVVKPVVAVVDSPKVAVKPMVKPVVAVVDSPKVAVKPVVKPVVVVVDSPKVVTKPVVKPVVAVVDSPKVAVQPVVKPEVAGQDFVLNHIYFDANQHTLRPEGKAELTRLYELLRQHPTMEIHVSGYTDGATDGSQNLALSEARAATVVNYLKYKGIMGYRLSGKGYGDSKPLGSNATAEGRAMNRRVEFTVVKI